MTYEGWGLWHWVVDHGQKKLGRWMWPQQPINSQNTSSFLGICSIKGSSAFKNFLRGKVCWKLKGQCGVFRCAALACTARSDLAAQAGAIMQNIVPRHCKEYQSIWRYCKTPKGIARFCKELQGVVKKLQSGIRQDMARHYGAQNALTTGGLQHLKFSQYQLLGVDKNMIARIMKNRQICS